MRAKVVSSRSFIRPAMFDLRFEWTVGVVQSSLGRSTGDKQLFRLTSPLFCAPVFFFVCFFCLFFCPLFRSLLLTKRLNDCEKDMTYSSRYQNFSFFCHPDEPLPWEARVLENMVLGVASKLCYLKRLVQRVCKS